MPPKCLIEIYVRYLHNYIIKKSNNGRLAILFDSMTHKLMIIYTTLRSFIPSKVRKMTPKLCQICRHELCIILKDIQISLNIFITRLVSYLQHKYAERHT